MSTQTQTQTQPQKQNTNFNAFSATLSIHKDHVGFILGKKCCNINGLALMTNTRITGWNDNKESHFSNFIICGRSVQDVHRAYSELCQLANTVDIKTPRAHTLFPQSFFPTQIQGIETRLVVHQSAVGILLGKQGNTIHTITKTTGTWAKFYQADSKNDGKPTFSIRAFYQQDLDKALKKMTQIIGASTHTNTSSPTHLTVADVAQVIDLTQPVQPVQPVQRANDEEPQSPCVSAPKRVSFKIISKE